MRVLLTGTYCSKNKGDASMQQVFSDEVRKERPQAQIIIAAPFPKIDAGHYTTTTIVKSGRRNLPLATLHWLFLVGLRVLRHRPNRYLLNAEIDEMSRADVVVDLSGDMLTEDYGPVVGYSHFLPLLQAQALGKPVIICAQSVGPFRYLKCLARRILSRAALITVRESITPKLLDELNGPSIKSVRTADLAFLLKPAAPDCIDALFEKEGIPAKPTRPRLGVSVSALLTNRTNRHLGTGRENSIDSFALALDAVAEELGIEVFLVPHVFGPKPAGDDRQAGEKLASLMRNPPLRLRGEYRPEEIKGMIGRCDAFVGCRMHANIAALESGVPVLAIGYSHKTRGILSDLGLGDWILPIDEIDPKKLTDGIARLFTESSAYRQLLRAKLPAMRQSATENIDLAMQVIDAAVRRNRGE